MVETRGSPEASGRSGRSGVPRASEPESGPSSSVSDAALLRRREQNRINQRTSRQRKRQSQPPQPWASRWVFYTADEQELHRMLRAGLQTRFCDMDAESRNLFVARLREQAVDGATQLILRSERLLSVAQYNIIMGIRNNAALLGLTLEDLSLDIVSPFNDSSRPFAGDLPPSMLPTPLQRRVPHHPWIDLFPSPFIRETLLGRMGDYDEDELCHDMFGGWGQVGVLIWGEPTDPASYEMSEALLEKYPWLISGLSGQQILGFTNRWRRKRGEKPLAWHPRLEPVEVEEVE